VDVTWNVCGPYHPPSPFFCLLLAVGTVPFYQSLKQCFGTVTFEKDPDHRINTPAYGSGSSSIRQ
jgi:hypothetical protein